MAKETTYAGMLGSWRRLLAALEANAAELGHLEGSRAKLERLFAETLEANSEQAALKSSKQDASRQVQSLFTAGERLATVLRLAIKEHYGIRAEKLAEFGLQPFRGRKKLTPAPEEPASGEPEAATNPTS